ncbi:triosephosphate isomerase (TIM) [Myxococcaceae bacterium]|nr:triosephosphate isomerase (TIM) [Myxococcaceae bacterium]
MRVPILAANWKMHKTVAEALAFVEAFLPSVRDVEGVEIVIAPPFTALDRVGEALGGSNVELAAQDVHAELFGAFTGEVSATMLSDVGCRYGIVGHSERRTLCGETDAEVGAKATTLLRNGIRPIFCVGESLDEREAGRAFDRVGEQLDKGLAKIPSEQAEELVVAYEPIWAIGTGRTASPQDAQEMHAFIRDCLARRFASAASSIRIQYGGSVKPDNVYALMAQPDIDGALVGGASLDPESFARIVRFAPPEESK